MESQYGAALFGGGIAGPARRGHFQSGTETIVLGARTVGPAPQQQTPDFVAAGRSGLDAVSTFAFRMSIPPVPNNARVSILGACNDAVPDDGNHSVPRPFTEAYFGAAAAILATKPSPAEARVSGELLLRHYGLRGTIRVLSSEVECTAEVTLSNGDRLVLKTSSRPEGRDSFRFQVAALAGLEGACGFAAPHIVRTSVGTLMFEEEEICGYLQTRVSGVPLHQADATPDVLYRVEWGFVNPQDDPRN